MDSYLYSDILELIERQAERWRDAIAIEDGGDLRLSYGDLAVRVGTLGRSLSAHGISATRGWRSCWRTVWRWR